MYQYFYNPYKEFMNNNLDFNKSSQFKSFVKEVFGNYNVIYICEHAFTNDTEKYASNTYNTLLMLSIYNRLGMSLVTNKLIQRLKQDKSYENEEFDDLYCYEYKPNHVKKLFDMILELQKEPNNNMDKILMSFCIKALFTRIYSIYNDDKYNNNDDDIMNIISNLFKEEKYKNIYYLMNDYQMNCYDIVNEYEKIQYDRNNQFVYYLTKEELFTDHHNQDNSCGVSSRHVVEHDITEILLVDEIKFLLNFFDIIRYRTISYNDFLGYLKDSQIMLPSAYIKFITPKYCTIEPNVRSFPSDRTMTEHSFEQYRRGVDFFKSKVSSANEKFNEIGKSLGYNNYLNNKESNKIEKKE